MIITYMDPEYTQRRRMLTQSGKQNGAYYYSMEICNNIIPLVKTVRPWVTVNTGQAFDNAIVFIHNNRNPKNYDFLKKYKNLILVCSIPETCEKVKHLGTPIYLPLSVDVDYVRRFRRPKDRDACYYGRRAKIAYDGVKLPPGTPVIAGRERPNALSTVARYRKCYAVGRAAIEAKILGCDVLPYDPRYPDPEMWQILDNRDAAKMLQEKLDEIDNDEVNHE